MEKTSVDYLSLDVEGAEYDILKAAFNNTNDLKFNVAGIETTYFDRPQFSRARLELIYLMKRNGYKLQTHIGEDDFYIHESFGEPSSQNS